LNFGSNFSAVDVMYSFCESSPQQDGRFHHLICKQGFEIHRYIATRESRVIMIAEAVGGYCRQPSNYTIGSTV
jgi:hypothetical protein